MENLFEIIKNSRSLAPLCFLSVVTRLFSLLSDYSRYEGGCDLIDRDTYWWNLELLYHAFMPDYVAKILQIPLSQFDVPDIYIYISHNRGIVLMKGNVQTQKNKVQTN